MEGYINNTVRAQQSIITCWGLLLIAAAFKSGFAFGFSSLNRLEVVLKCLNGWLVNVKLDFARINDK